MPNLTLTELARADGMVWIKVETTVERGNWDFGDMFAWIDDSQCRVGRSPSGRFVFVMPSAGKSHLLVPESDEPRLREIEKRVNEVGQ